ncbi:hypothetical protein [Lutibacter sp.]|uniref:hypothetical protein n=1 Tax=Lutibacter sp. TaxID=1925666 RepID=UPI002737151E|nr:hypothetical protein [Lutibacter sp.]MDP3311933.1 hypothetical protein [Lutibacter sp.]
MKNRKFVFLFIVLSVTFLQSQNKIKITTNYSDAQIFKMRDSEVIKPMLGVGTAEHKLVKNELNRIMIVKEGFQPLIKDFPKTIKWPSVVQLILENRMVEIKVEPYDAEIFIDGVFVGSKSFTAIIKKDAALTVEIKKKGFKTLKKTYFNKESESAPPIIDNFSLQDRAVQVKISPADAEIYSNQKLIGVGSAEVVIPKGECTFIQAKKEGFTLEEKVFCNKENDDEPPLAFNFLLKDRLVKMEVTPKTAEIKVDGKIVGVGNYELKVPENTCVEVILFKESFLSVKKNYCNSKDYQVPPLREHFELSEDEAYKTSISTDLANVNFSIVVKPQLNASDSWKLLSSIVTTEFDVLEVIDKETGYLRTAWQVHNFKGSTIRTRVIVKLGDSNPLKYVIKISSERADGLASVKEDEKFEEWNRILKKYKNIIEEAQSRL